MSQTSDARQIAERSLKQLRGGDPVADVVAAARASIGERFVLLDEVWRTSLELGSVDDGTIPPTRFIDLLVSLYRFGAGLGAAYSWRKGVVDAARQLSHVLIDRAREHERAISELTEIEAELFRADPAVWATIQGDIGIAHLWLGRPRQAIAALSVPCALMGTLLAQEASALYLGNLGLAFAMDGLHDEARMLLTKAIESCEDEGLRAKLQADLAKVESASGST